MSKWCEVKEVGNLDSAVCNSVSRPGFLTNFSDKQLNITAGINDDFMNWIHFRSIKPISFVSYVSNGFGSWMMAVNWSEVIEITLVNHDASPDQDAHLVPIVNKCEKLMSIRFINFEFSNNRHMVSKFCDMVLSQLTKISCDYLATSDFNARLFMDTLLTCLADKCHELRSLKIHCRYDNDVSESVVLNLIKNNPHLEKIAIKFVAIGDEMFSNDFLPALIVSCPNLTDLILDRVCYNMNIKTITKTLADDNKTGRFMRLINNGTNDSGEAKFVYTSENNVRSVVFENVLSEETYEKLEFFTRVVNLHHVELLNWTEVSDALLGKLAVSSPNLRTLKIYSCDDEDNDDHSFYGLNHILKSCRELHTLTIGCIAHLLCEQLLVVFLTPKHITSLSLTLNNYDKCHVFSCFLVGILQANLQLTTLCAYDWPVEENMSVKDYLHESGRVLEFITHRDDN